jgi:hypothetical protein
MNKIRVRRLLYAGLATLLTFVAVEFVVESLLFGPLFGRILGEWHGALQIQGWRLGNSLLNITIALVNCTLLTWLYAALRPMFGVGPRTALVTSAFAYLFVAAFAINGVNVGTYPLRIAGIELLYQLVELPIAILVGASVYEGGAS